MPIPRVAIFVFGILMHHVNKIHTHILWRTLLLTEICFKTGVVIDKNEPLVEDAGYHKTFIILPYMATWAEHPVYISRVTSSSLRVGNRMTSGNSAYRFVISTHLSSPSSLSPVTGRKIHFALNVSLCPNADKRNTHSMVTKKLLIRNIANSSGNFRNTT